MRKPEVKAPLVDRPLDAAAAERVKKPGVGVIVTPKCSFEHIVREASDVARVRDRIIYVFLVSSELDSIQPGYREWKESVFEKCHALKVERIVLPGVDIVQSLHDYCRTFDIRILMMEEVKRPRFYLPWAETMADKIHFAPNLPPSFILRSNQKAENELTNWGKYQDWWILFIGLFILGSTGLLFRDQVPESFEILLYVLTLAVISSRVNRVASVVGSLIAALQFNIIHVQPYGSVLIQEPLLWLNIVGIAIVSLIISTLSWQVRISLSDAQLQERRKSSFFALTRDLLQTREVSEILELVDRHVRDVVGSEIGVFVKKRGDIETLREGSIDLQMSVADQSARDMALDLGVEAGVGTQNHSLAFGLYLPITKHENFSGCLAVYPSRYAGSLPAEMLRILDTITSLLGIALERLWQEDQRIETERMIRDSEIQVTMLRSVSHDLKTPLTTITGFANQLFEDPDMPEDMRIDTYGSIRDEAWRLTNLINNLLSMTRLESGGLVLNLETMYVEEIFGTAISNVRKRLVDHKLTVDLPEDIPDVSVDAILINQAIVNLLENAIKYTPPGTEVILRARRVETGVQISVLDDGPGLEPGSYSKIFEKFVRSKAGKNIEGTGLGLAIVKAIAAVHGGEATARNRTRKGARFDMRIPAAQLGVGKEEKQK